MNTRKEERKLNLEDVIVCRKWDKGLMLTDLYGEVFTLSNKEYDTDAIFDLFVSDINVQYFKNGNRYFNLSLIKDVKTEIKPANSTYAVKVLCENGHVEVFNCANENETLAIKKQILKLKAETESALEI